jgi:hypothetical protein
VFFLTALAAAAALPLASLAVGVHKSRQESSRRMQLRQQQQHARQHTPAVSTSNSCPVYKLQAAFLVM